MFDEQTSLIARFEIKAREIIEKKQISLAFIEILNVQSDFPVWECIDPSCDAHSGIIDNKIAFVGTKKKQGVKIIQ